MRFVAVGWFRWMMGAVTGLRIKKKREKIQLALEIS